MIFEGTGDLDDPSHDQQALKAKARLSAEGGPPSYPVPPDPVGQHPPAARGGEHYEDERDESSPVVLIGYGIRDESGHGQRRSSHYQWIVHYARFLPPLA